MIRRLGTWTIAILIGADVLLASLLFGPKFVLVGGQPVNGRQTISGRVGRGVVMGKRWARLVAPLIDVVIAKLGGERHHCLLSYAWEQAHGVEQ